MPFIGELSWREGQANPVSHTAMEDTLTPHRANKMLLFKVRSCDVRLSNKVRRQREADLLCNTISLSMIERTNHEMRRIPKSIFAWKFHVKQRGPSPDVNAAPHTSLTLASSFLATLHPLSQPSTGSHPLDLQGFNPLETTVPFPSCLSPFYILFLLVIPIYKSRVRPSTSLIFLINCPGKKKKNRP
ncbi:Serine/threonine-protein kinase oca2 [Fusarium oxysporum f. sp. albedinis]|nr:Serine/threonine-protein kinase oca2 [Fusarium oxysporum f. sp. albedinis]